MASFRTHVSFGIAFGVLSGLAIIALALVPDTWSFSILAGLAVTLGAQLPDMDSDSGLPFHITFGSLALVIGVLTSWYSYSVILVSLGGAILAGGIAIFSVWIVIGTVFKKFTKHRGMAHSIPVAVLAGLVTFSIGNTLNVEEWQSFLLGTSITCGYILHLVLDEIWAGLNFHGHLFVPNRAFGSALKFVSHDHRLTVLVYISIGMLLYGNIAKLAYLTERLFAAFQ
ncbi:MAG: hypothetical protein QG626_623 [Patescibacteria group bacterium]|jgi:hypothetical protein|nr:hypothetical protein [Patescibacteria group bacterium]